VDESSEESRLYPWYVVLWLTGVDYFSTLGYQPGIALLAAGALSVPATLVLVLVTLFGAVPVYMQVAKRSYVGQGSIALLEHVLSGWKSKIFVLILLGFAATDFVITMTLSAADAARHAIANSAIEPLVGDSPIRVTLGLLLLLAIVFIVGFREAIGLAQIVAVPYLLLNVVVLLRALWEVVQNPAYFHNWRQALHGHGDWTAILVASALVFPKLALGLSGFETGVSVMPLVAPGAPKPGSPPTGRIQATWKLLVAAALIMSALLILSSVATALLIPEADYRVGGAASGRALAYLAHRLLGPKFAALYDIVTILILWFAGASAMTGLLNLIPRYLPRYGMAPHWVSYRRPLVLVLLVINMVVTLAFRAEVEAQGGAYATGVLVLMLSGSVAVTLALWKEMSAKRFASMLLPFYFGLITLVFVYTLLDNVIGRPDGIIIATIFITLLLILSAVSRYQRSTEMRITEMTIADPNCAALFASMRHKQVNLVPYRVPTAEYRQFIAGKIRRHYKIDGPLAFLHASLLDNRSEFLADLRLQAWKEGDDYVVEVGGAVAIANAIAYVSELLDPVSVVLGLTHRNLMRQSMAYLLWGEGETGLMVYSILVRRWEWMNRSEGLPLIFLMSGDPG
jgi:hypothetical protein